MLMLILLWPLTLTYSALRQRPKTVVRSFSAMPNGYCTLTFRKTNTTQQTEHGTQATGLPIA
jgi:hypothetical protein